ncbi:MAG: ATP-dependent sacrificial sulfur transferase LarE [Planctomycetia bacterium]|nr:ATP-dependent sacrificial sulfur transferase LarE [Planctomycetia bacterium]
MLKPELEQKLQSLFQWFKGRACVIAFSGGVDSTTLAKALLLASEEGLLKAPVVGYYAQSPSSTKLESDHAIKTAQELGLDLRVMQSTEFNEPLFVENSPQRCYWCKKIRFSAIVKSAESELGKDLDVPVNLLDGSNENDHGDFRPGLKAAQEVGVLSPFSELHFTKDEIRQLAAHWNLSVANKPSNPCLASRMAYYLPLDEKYLRQIEKGEEFLYSLGYQSCRVRVDTPLVARIEVPTSLITELASDPTRTKIVEKFREIGFNFIALDLEGFYSGKNNRAILNASEGENTTKQ